MSVEIGERAERFVVEIENILGRELSQEEREKLMRAYSVAEYAHEGDFRQSGEPFVEHPKEVSRILARLNVDVDSIIAGLLHDTVEDSHGKVTLEDIRREFGDEIAKIVDGVTKVSRINAPVGEGKVREKLETIQKMLFAMAEDIRVIFVKLADRLHNMRTIDFVKNEEKKRYKAMETLEVYAPIAHKLGIHTIKAELEDLSFKVLHREEYYKLKRLVSQKRKERESRTKEYINILKSALEEHGIEAEVEGRYKHYYSIWKKMKEKGKSFDEIYDLIAVRAILKSVRDCYTTLGIVHSIWKPLPGRFKDYIAAPKSNGYRSLHTTVITQYGEPLEVQIRDVRMHQEAEYGLIAHWIYKEKLDIRTMQRWIGMLLEWKKEVSQGLIGVADLKKELELDEVFVFTPKGEIKHLPKGSTPIDFAYSIHTEIGHHFAGARFNGRMVPIDYELQSGDVVEIIVNRNSPGPSLDWIKYARSPRTRAKIRKFFKDKYMDQIVEKGKDVLRSISRRIGKSIDEILSSPNMKKFMESQGLNEKELMVRLGEGTITKEHLLRALGFMERQKRKSRKTRRRYEGPIVVVQGIKGLDVHIAKCCRPVPGDRIVGVVSRRGITIHRIGCPNVRKVDPDRVFHASWSSDVSGDFVTTICVEIETKSALGDVIDRIEGLNSSVEKVEMKSTPWNTSRAVLGIRVKDLDQMNDIISELKGLKKVISVERMIT